VVHVSYIIIEMSV